MDKFPEVRAKYLSATDVTSSPVEALRGELHAQDICMIFLLINLLAAHLASDCGLPAVFGRDACADDIARAGWPLTFYEEGGFAYRQNFDSVSLLINLGTGLVVAVRMPETRAAPRPAAAAPARGT